MTTRIGGKGYIPDFGSSHQRGCHRRRGGPLRSPQELYRPWGAHAWRSSTKKKSDNREIKVNNGHIWGHDLRAYGPGQLVSIRCTAERAKSTTYY